MASEVPLASSAGSNLTQDGVEGGVSEGGVVAGAGVEGVGEAVLGVEGVGAGVADQEVGAVTAGQGVVAGATVAAERADARPGVGHRYLAILWDVPFPL